jgi:hypothetical protein
MASNKIYCCEIHVESRGFPHELVQSLFPEPPQDLQTYGPARSLLEMELDTMGACEHYRNQSFIVHRNSYGSCMSAEIQLADYLGLTIDQYLDILASPTG